ncbi:MAG: TonB-dependent receptor [Idiomarina sp.]|nr:TonB-dependent receptor [Idiomarina sp.]
MFNSTFKRTALAAALAAVFSGTVYAQDTASAMRGSVVGPQGNGAGGTEVVIRHVPSGSTVTVTTDEDGNFVANGLRVGGPYQVVLDSDVYRDAAYQDIYLQLGSTYRLNAQLEADEMERLQVSGSAINYASLNRGSGSSFGEEQIEKQPTYGRDLKDVLRLNPLATQIGDGSELTVAGNNPKYNSITVDGIGQNDDFGLNGNGYPTQRSPISIDAIEQVSIDVVPFSVKDSNFTGAKINAVTKSGTNEFKGSVFYQYASDSLAGDPEPNRYYPDSTAPELDYEEKTKGFGLGGPIIEDTLFFYVNYEKTEEPQPVARGPQGSTASNFANVSADDVELIQDIARDVYQVEPGDWNINPVEEDEKVLAKIDWNINNDHRLAVTYQSTEGQQTRNNGGSTGTLTLSSNWYSNTQELKAYSAQLYSNWTSDFSTEIKLSKKEVDNGRVPLLGKNYGQARIETGEAAVYIGPDYSSQANELQNDTTQFQFNAEYLKGDHLIQAGYDYTSVDVYNLFAEATLGAWEFDSIEDFRNQVASGFEYKNHPSGNVDNVAAIFTQGTHSIYLQDTWTPTWDLEITYGVRYEQIFADDQPRLNDRFVQRYQFANTENLDGVDIILPRVGFKWNFADDMTLRGGVGKYSGGRPNVWISNAYTNDGIGAVNFDPSSIDSSVYLENVDLANVPQEVVDSLVAGDGIVTPIDPNFELPSEWRSSLAIDWNGADLGYLGEDWFLSAEFIYGKKQDDVAWTDLSRRTLLDENGNPVTTSAGRPIYVADDPLDNHVPSEIGDDNGISRYDLMLTNGRSGDSKILTLTAGKAWDNGLSFNTSYTHQDVTEAFAGGSSTAWSNYRYTPTVDAENVLVNTAGYEVEHRFVANLSYTTQLMDGYDSSFTLFWERYSGRPYSYVLDTYGNSVFGDAGNLARPRYLPYIPTGPDDSNVEYTDGLTYEQLLPLLQEAGLDQYAGGFAPMNEFRGPWNTTLDFNYTQELPGFMDEHKFTLFFDVRNILALIDEDSAQQHYLFNGSPTTQFVKGDINPETGNVVYGRPYAGYDTSAPTSYLPERSTWQAKIGIRYTF